MVLLLPFSACLSRLVTRADTDTAGVNDVMALCVSGEGVAELDVSTFSTLKLVKTGEHTTFDCQYHNAIATEWYRQDRRLSNDTDSSKYVINCSLLEHTCITKQCKNYQSNVKLSYK